MKFGRELKNVNVEETTETIQRIVEHLQFLQSALERELTRIEKKQSDGEG